MRMICMSNMQEVKKPQKFWTALSPNAPPLSLDADDHIILYPSVVQSSSLAVKYLYHTKLSPTEVVILYTHLTPLY